jgi:anti-sigma factor RsiW
MSELFPVAESECVRARSWFTSWLDGELTQEQSEWLQVHLSGCRECHLCHERFVALDAELTGWGMRVGAENPPPPGQKALLTIGMTEPAPRRTLRWMPAVTLAAAAALLLTVYVEQKKPDARTAASGRESAQFIDIPYLAPLDPRENATIVRMDIQVATLMSLGYRVAADPDEVVPADVLVGEDGRAHAVRVISGIDVDGARGD